MLNNFLFYLIRNLSPLEKTVIAKNSELDCGKEIELEKYNPVENQKMRRSRKYIVFDEKNQLSSDTMRSMLKNNVHMRCRVRFILIWIT